MTFGKLVDGVFAVGTEDPKRRLFDALIPTPKGTTYNSYFVRGTKKCALIDTADPSTENEYLENLKELPKEPDYIIVNHAEQDHSGLLPKVLEKYPNARVVTNEKCAELLNELLFIPLSRIDTIENRRTLDLGGKTLEFLITPWVHWPETMQTWLVEDRILFSCDLFGAHVTGKAQAECEKELEIEAKRYYAEIMMPFRPLVRKHVETVSKLGIRIIAPSHGPVYAKGEGSCGPEWIIGKYRDWTSDDVANKAVIAYISMHGSTEKMAEYLQGALEKEGVETKLFNLENGDIGDLASECVDCATIVIGTPAVLTGPHPKAAYATMLLGALRPKAKFLSVICSYGWGQRVLAQMQPLFSHPGTELIDPVIVKGAPDKESFKELDFLAEKIALKHIHNKIM